MRTVAGTLNVAFTPSGTASITGVHITLTVDNIANPRSTGDFVLAAAGYTQLYGATPEGHEHSLSDKYSKAGVFVTRNSHLKLSIPKNR